MFVCLKNANLLVFFLMLGIGKLIVLMKENNRVTEIWRETGNQGRNWQKATIDIGRVDGAFQVGTFLQKYMSKSESFLVNCILSNKIFPSFILPRIMLKNGETLIFVLYSQLLIRATRTLSVQGDIAIDDLQFINCNYPGNLLYLFSSPVKTRLFSYSTS